MIGNGFWVGNQKVNYLGASPRGIRWKQIFNFEASLGVLYPLAVPIKPKYVKNFDCFFAYLSPLI
ncbi:hypothetical protein AB832_00065 [Flavobacteriaceae bacterium (ex Bugula neritina AB1)]|nr:hypothetical protein AB832_00065 [Flavobacteriaceae bacterium (ex Bugula neritina AB1)]